MFVPMLVESIRWHPVPDERLRSLPEGASLRVVVKGRAVRFIRLKGKLRALVDRCPHQGKSFEGGWCEGDHFVCPWHRFAFDPVTGRSRSGSTVNVEAFEVEERSDTVLMGFHYTTLRLFGIDLW